MISKNVLWGWVAGIIDGEGYVGIRCSKGRDGIPKWFKPFVRVGTTDKATCNRLLFVTKVGSVRLLRRKTRAGKPVWEWSAYCRQASEFCQTVLPLLVCKKKQAEAIVKLGLLNESRHGYNRAPLTKIEWTKRLKLKSNAHDANHDVRHKRVLYRYGEKSVQS